MRVSRTFGAAAAAITLCGITSAVTADVITAVDINSGGSPTYAGSFVSPVDSTSAAFVGGEFPNTPTDSFSVSTPTAYSSGTVTFLINHDGGSTDRGIQANDAGTYQDVYRDLVIVPDGTTLTISGLNASTQYGITLQGYEPGASSFNSTFTPVTSGVTNPPTEATISDVSGTSPSDSLFNPLGSVTFDGATALTSDASGNIVFTLSSTVDSYMRVNGIEIYTATPEPASLALLSLGAVGLLARRRRPTI